LASSRVKRYLRITKGNEIRIDRSAIHKAAKYDGKWVLVTNDDTMMIERIAERACGKPWHQIRRPLDSLQVTKLFNLNQRVHLRNEIAADTRNILKKLNIKVPKQILRLENSR
jgi:hypothetical protein